MAPWTLWWMAKYHDWCPHDIVSNIVIWTTRVSAIRYFISKESLCTHRLDLVSGMPKVLSYKASDYKVSPKTTIVKGAKPRQPLALIQTIRHMCTGLYLRHNEALVFCIQWTWRFTKRYTGIFSITWTASKPYEILYQQWSFSTVIVFGRCFAIVSYIFMDLYIACNSIVWCDYNWASYCMSSATINAL